MSGSALLISDSIVPIVPSYLRLGVLLDLLPSDTKLFLSVFSGY